ncbi:MAG: D-Ala-D-Ala carboxypeptidase family metallohydrolase [Rubrivivax sp.]
MSRRFARAALVALGAALAAGCAQHPRGEAAFAAWREQAPPRAEAAGALERHLVQHGVHGVLPLHALLRSASSWQDCAAEPFAVPPPAQWPSVVSVLALLRELRQRGIVGEVEIHSGYRGPALNSCAGGAAGSAHLRSFALDFTTRDGTDPTGPLCAFWRTHGPAWNMGLGRYPSGRLHIDTAGFRTWGADHGSGSSVCKALTAP